jgi:peptide/nickel transport system permease protein
MVLLALLGSWFLFALEPLATDENTPPAMRAQAGESGAIPIWLDPAAYSAFWAHRLRGDLDYSVLNPAYPTGRPGRALQPEAKARLAQTLALLGSAMAVALLAGTALGWVIRAWSRRLGWGTDLPLLEAAGQIPVAAFTVFVVLAMGRLFGVQPNFGRYQGFLEISDWNLLVFPAAALALPLLPRIARLWTVFPFPRTRGALGAWAAEARRSVADVFLCALGWAAVVEVAFSYPGLGEWAIKSAMEVWVVQTWLFFVTLLAFAALVLGGGTRLRPSGPLRGFGSTIRERAAGRSARGWLLALAERDAFVVGLYALLAVAGALAFAGEFPGMQQVVDRDLLDFHPASPDYPLGSDVTGRNVWRMVINGARLYLPLSLAAAAAAVALAWALGWLGRRWPRIRAGLWLGWAALSAYPAVMWSVVVVLLAGRGTWPLSIGLFLAVLPAAMTAFLPVPAGAAASEGPRAARTVILAGSFLVAASYSLLVLTHATFLGVGERYAGTEWSSAFGETFARPHPDWVLASAPELLLTLAALALFVPGQVMLNLAARGDSEPAPGA